MRPKSILSIGKAVLALAWGLGAVAAPQAQAQTFSVIHNFTGGKDGANPLSGFLLAGGNLFGTASSGGSSGLGVVFWIKTTTGQETVLHEFTGGADGANPEGKLISFGGNLYGTTTAGGAHNAGTVYQITVKGAKETVLYSFTGKADGASPVAGLTLDKAGNLYGTTTAGGANGNGAVFELQVPTVAGGAWTEKVLYSFGTGTDGSDPVAGVTFDGSGNLYGTTSAGGTYTYGTVFQLTPSTPNWKETILHHFELQADGGVPYAGLTLSGKNLFGASTDGGAGGSSGGGTVFELTPISGGGWKFNVIYSLAGWGISGPFRNLLLSSGKIFGTTHCDGANDAGTVYELTNSGGVWSYKSLYVFTGSTDGLFLFSNLVSDTEGNLYGTTNGGGANGYGVAFKVTP
jgi:uncharacterized repeat protein (TIGR03803 family)